MDKKETYDRLRMIAALKLIQENTSLSIKTRVDAGIAKTRSLSKLRALFAPKAEKL